MDPAIETTLFDPKTLQTWPAGASLFREGEEPRGIYVLWSGEAELSATANGGSQPFGVATAGKILGLSAAVMRGPHECSATTRTRCEVGFFDRGTFLQALEDRPSIWLSVLKILSNEVDAAYAEMRSLMRR